MKAQISVFSHVTRISLPFFVWHSREKQSEAAKSDCAGQTAPVKTQGSLTCALSFACSRKSSVFEGGRAVSAALPPSRHPAEFRRYNHEVGVFVRRYKNLACGCGAGKNFCEGFQKTQVRAPNAAFRRCFKSGSGAPMRSGALLRLRGPAQAGLRNPGIYPPPPRRCARSTGKTGSSETGFH